MINSVKWLGGSTLISIIVVAVATDFTFRDTEIQLHDTYFVISAWHKIFFLAFSLVLTCGFSWLVDSLAEKSKAFATAFSIINAVAVIFMSIITFLMLKKLGDARKNYPDLQINNYVLILFLMSAIITIMIIIEVRTIRKIRHNITNKDERHEKAKR